MLAVRRAVPEVLDAAQSALEHLPFTTYAQFACLAEEEGLRALSLEHLRRDIQRNMDSSWIAEGNDGSFGVAVSAVLNWDSERLGFLAGRLEQFVATGDYGQQKRTKSDLIDVVLDDASRKGIRHFSARADSSDLSTIHALEEHGFITVDGILTFAIDLRPEPSGGYPPGIDVRLANGREAEELAAIGSSAYVHDRFHSDPCVPAGVADRIYADWTRNSVNGEASDAVIVAGRGGRAESYVTCKIDREAAEYLGFKVGIIVLVASSESARGRGLGSAATRGALRWFADNGVRVAQVGTQLTNIQASRLYESCGFRLVSSSLSMRKWVKNG